MTPRDLPVPSPDSHPSATPNLHTQPLSSSAGLSTTLSASSPPLTAGSLSTATTDEDGFILVHNKKTRSRASKQGNESLLFSHVSHSSSLPCITPKPSVSVQHSPPLQYVFPGSSYEAVASLESNYPELQMQNLIRKDGSSVLLPKDDTTYQILDSIASNTSAQFKITKLDPQTQTTKGIVMGYSMRMSLALLQRHP